MRRLTAPILVFEAIILGLAVPVAIAIDDANPAVVGTGAGVLIVILFALSGMLKHRWAYVAGSALQLIMIATGVVVSAMYFLGALFALLWATAIWLGNREYEQPEKPGTLE